MSNTNTPFAVTFHLSAPVAAGQGPKPPMIMLDGLVAYAVAQETFGPRGFTRRPHRNTFVDLPLPLATVMPGLYAASQGFVARSRRQLAVLTQRDDHSESKSKTRAQFQPRLIPLAATATPAMTFFGRGDLDQVLTLLRWHIKFLGSKRASGYGHIVKITGEPVPVDLSWGRFDALGLHFHRPMPVDCAEDLNQIIGDMWGAPAQQWWTEHAAEWPRDRLALSAPYYDPARQQWCYSPDEFGLIEPVSFLPSHLSSRGDDEEDVYSEEDFEFDPEIPWEDETD